MGIDSFCEAIRPCAWVLQPVCSTSALAFLPVAAAVVWLSWRFDRAALNLLTASLVAMGLGTWVHHATGTWAGALADHGGMQLAATALLLVNLRRAGGSWGALSALGTVFWLGMMAITLGFAEARRWIVFVAMIPSGLVELWLWSRPVDHRWLFVGWALFVVAVAAWFFDRGVGCRPEGWIQLHAFWHVLGALSMGAWARYYAQFESLRLRG